MEHCHNCSSEVDNIAYAMRYGCTTCGGRKFSTKIKKLTLPGQDSNAEILDDITIVGIRVHSNGKYSINLPALTRRTSNVDPVIIEDSDGKMNIIIDPED